MAERKNHHYVPQFYFRLFSKDSKSICTLLRKSGRVIPGAPIKGQASKPWFYGNAEAEGALSEIEGHCSAAIRQLVALENPSALDEEHVDWLLAHIALQRSRTQAARDAGQPFRDKMAQLMFEVGVNNADDLDADTKAALLDETDLVEADPVQAQGLEMGIAMQHSRALADLTPLMLVNKTNRPFVFGDAPVIYYNAQYRDVSLRGVLGMAAPGLMVIMPLSSRTCLMLLDEEAYKVRGVRANTVAVRQLSDVMSLNKLQLHAAADCVYFEDIAFAPYVEAVWRDEQARLTKHAGMVVQAPAFAVETGSSMGEVVHGFQPQLDFRANFSFLKYAVYGDEDRRPLRRATCVF